MNNKSSRRDLLSDLPLSIIHIILSLIPIEEVVRTSILSRQWRYVWNSIPHLAFNDTRVENERDEERLIHFINQALLLHKGPIQTFKLHLSYIVDSEYIDQWLLFLSKNDIRILVLRFYDDWYNFQSSLYSCQYLTHLELLGNKVTPPPPFFNGFLCLRSLNLCHVQASSSTIESIVTHSPLLEELTLHNHKHKRLTIRAPKLKCFHFNSMFFRLSLYTPLLEELKGELSEIQHFSIGVGTSMFRHLRIIELTDVSFDRMKVTVAVIHLTMTSPNLHKLIISNCSCGEDDAPELACVSFSDTESVPDFTYDSLKVIKITNFGGSKIIEMKLIRFLLERSPVLEKMKYWPDSSLSDRQLLTLTVELLSYRRASANAVIVIAKY